MKDGRERKGKGRRGWRKGEERGGLAPKT